MIQDTINGKAKRFNNSISRKAEKLVIDYLKECNLSDVDAITNQQDYIDMLEKTEARIANEAKAARDKLQAMENARDLKNRRPGKPFTDYTMEELVNYFGGSITISVDEHGNCYGIVKK